MPDEPQNPITEENSIPVNPEEPTADILIPPSTSEPAPMPPEAPEAPREVESTVPLNNDNAEITLSEAQKPEPEPTAQIEAVEENTPVSEAPTQPMAQMAG